MYEELFWGNEEEKIPLIVTFLGEKQEDILDQISVVAFFFFSLIWKNPLQHRLHNWIIFRADERLKDVYIFMKS